MSNSRSFGRAVCIISRLILAAFCMTRAASAAPANNNFASAQVLSGATGSVTGTNVGATKETGEPDHGGNGGATSIWYKWTAPATKATVFSTTGSNFDTLLAIYTANGTPTVGTLTEVDSDDDGGGNRTSQINFNATSGVIYYVAIIGYDGASGTVALRWAMAPNNDNFAAAQSLTGLSGTATGSNAAASKETDEPNHFGYSGGASVWYKWTATATASFTFDTIGSNFDTLLGIYTANGSPATVGALTEVASDGNSGDSTIGTSKAKFDAVSGTTYYIAVDGYDSVGTITLHWGVTRPDNDDLVGATDLDSNSGTLTDSNLAATAQAGEPDHDISAASKSLWYSWTYYGTAAATFDTVGSNFDTVLAVYTSSSTGTPTITSLVPVASDDDGGGGATSKVSFTPEYGTTYYIAVDGFGGASGTFKLNWGVQAGNDDFVDAYALYGTAGTTTESTVGATSESGEPLHAGISGGSSVWYYWEAPSYGNITFRTANGTSQSSYDTLLGVYTGTDIDTLAPVTGGSNDNVSAADHSSKVTFAVVPGTVYYIAVDGKNTGSGTAVGNLYLEWAFAPLAPPNDPFAGAQLLTGAAGTVNGSNVGATAQAGEPAHAGSAASCSVWYKWVAPTTRTVTFDTVGGDLNPSIAIYTSTVATPTLANLTAAASVAYGSDGVHFVATSAKTYYIALNSSSQYGVTLNWASAPPNDNLAASQLLSGRNGSVTGTNVGATTETGESADHSVWYKWTAPATAQVALWTGGSDFDTYLEVYKPSASPVTMQNLNYVTSDNDSGGDGTSSLRFDAVVGTVYYIRVQSYYDSVGSIVLNWAMAPDNDNFAAAQPLAGNSGTVAGRNSLATKETGELSHSGNIGGKSVWYKWTAPAAGYSVQVSLNSSDADLRMTLYTTGGTGWNSLLSLPVDREKNDAQHVNFSAVAGKIYYIAIDGFNPYTDPSYAEEGTFSLDWTFDPTQAPPNDNFANALVLNGNSGSLAGGNVRATKETGEPNHAAVAGGTSVWYRWSSPNAGQLTVNSAGSGLDTLMGVYTGSAVNALTAVASNDNVSGGIVTSTVGPFAVAAGTNYSIAVDGKAAAQADVLLSWSFVPNAPVISGFAPALGDVGTAVLIKGTNLAGPTAVRFDGIAARFSVSAAGIRAIVPANARTGQVTVICASGTAVSVGSFTVAPRIAYLSPSSGLPGNSIVISGDNFTGATAVKFNGVTATFTISSATSITATVPAVATAGPVSVTTLAGTVVGPIFSLLPNITSIAPVSGPVGTTVTITGTNFVNVNSVTFNGASAPGIITSSTRIVAIVPPGASTGPVRITASAGSNTVANGALRVFTVTTPYIVSLSPQSGPVGTIVTISGSTLSAVTAVKFNGVSVGAKVTDINTATAGFQIVSATQIKARVPAGAGSGPVTLVNAAGTSGTAPYFYVTSPVITKFTPTGGPVGTSVVITGENLDGASVTFNGTAATGVVVNSSVQVTAKVPAGATTGLLKLTNTHGAASSGASFVVSSVAAPSVSGFTPAAGPVGSIVTISGGNMTAATAVKINGLSVGAKVADITAATAGFQVVSATQIKARVPIGASAGFVSVTNAGGAAVSTAVFGISPAVQTFTPARINPGDQITINGTTFGNATYVRIGGINSFFLINSATRITALVPANVTNGFITVENEDGTGTSLTGFTAAPQITSFTPAYAAPGTVVSIAGYNFTGASAVKFNGVTASIFSVDATGTGITATVPAAATNGPISVVNSAGSPVLTGTSALKFTTIPRITAFTPAAGVPDTEITITGTGLTGATGVIFVGSVATTTDDKSAQFTVVSDTQIKAVVPNGVTSGPLKVLNAAGASANLGNFTAAPTIANFTPTSGLTGSTVVIHGNNLTGATAVKINGVSVSSFVVNSAIQITAIVAPGTTSGPLVVTTPAGTATSAFQFTVTGAGSPTLRIGDATKSEGSIASNMTFTVSLVPASSQAVTVKYVTANGTATAGSDYTTTAGTLTIAAGQSSGVINVPLTGDTVVEPNETFLVNLNTPVGATIADAQGVGTITNDDVAAIKASRVMLSTARAARTGTVELVFTGALSGTASVGTNYSVSNGESPMEIVSGAQPLPNTIVLSTQNLVAGSRLTVTYNVQDNIGNMVTGNVQVTVR